MAEDLDVLEDWVGGLLAKASPAERRKLARAVATDLRRGQVKRIAEQKNPDGSGFVPRKKREPLRSKAGRLKRQATQRKSGAMFKKLRRASFLGLEATESEASVGFANATVARIARVHQDGLRDKVERRGNAPEVAYPRRQLLGFTDDDRRRLLDLVLAHLQV